MTDNYLGAQPSLLDREATGGEVAERGLTFQEAVMLAHIPRWLSEEGFTALIRESLSDIEVQFFVPGSGFKKEFIEVKDHAVSPVEFKRELIRFRQLQEASPGTFRWFTLACPSLSEGLKPLANSLRRLQGPFAFYATDEVVQDASYADFVKVVLSLNRDYTVEDARFLFERVAVKEEYGHSVPGEALFCQGLLDYHPHYGELSQSAVRAAFHAVSRLLANRLREPVSRREIESAILSAIPMSCRPAPLPVVIRTLSSSAPNGPGLCFSWERFFGGDGRAYPPASDWDAGVIGSLREAKQWVVKHRLTRRIRLEGSRRLSAAIAFGAVFSAVSGFVVEMNHRGQIWATDAHAAETGAVYALNIDQSDGEGNELVVVFGISKDIRADVVPALSLLGLSAAPLLSLLGETPVTSPEQANLLVGKAKEAIHRVLQAPSRYRKLHLFYAGPSHVALFFGHRLNALTPVQCYEWIGTGVYTPTCVLST